MVTYTARARQSELVLSATSGHRDIRRRPGLRASETDSAGSRGGWSTKTMQHSAPGAAPKVNGSSNDVFYAKDAWLSVAFRRFRPLFFIGKPWAYKK